MMPQLSIMRAIQQREPRGLSPAQAAVFELIRLVQSDADVRDLERVFKAEPLLAYLLLTLANSAAYRRPTPVASLGHAISLLGYQRLIKWLVLLLAIAGKDKSTTPLVYVAVARGYLIENLCAAAGRTRAERDEGFVVGAFSLLDAITGQSLNELLQDIRLPEAVVDALLGKKQDAITEAKRASEMSPISRDAANGPEIVKNLAIVYAWTGELDLSFETLAPLTKMAFGINYGELKRDPLWNQLRTDPRFDKLLAELAPKD